jgi:hypothetical protein
MFSSWRQEKALVALIDEAQALADKLASAKPHVVDAHAAAAWFWTAFHLSTGTDLRQIRQWKPAAVTRFANTAETKIAVLRKERAYASSDGLAIWLHTARAVTEPRIAPAVGEIWRLLARAGSNADGMTADLLEEASLPPDFSRSPPQGFGIDD